MRILNMRFKNLNSLAGEWSLDFTHPDYMADGIFAIIGPTGAGKTTILDAICLALYGRTPRLNRVNKSSNEIMSRLTGECMAEVCFATPDGSFRCHWSQHRARNKPDGELQNPRHELVHADSGKIIESRPREVVGRVEMLTGMDYERFTRSMLLAQGGFAAFLQAPSNERSPILEQITGTEIYSQISIKVHELRVEEARKLENLQAELAGIQLLSEEVKAQLHSQLEEKQAVEPELTKTLASLRQALAWVEGIAVLQKELAKLNEKKLDFEERRLAFQSQSQQLDQARKAQDLEGDFARLSSLRGQQHRELVELSEAQEKLPVVESVLREAQENFRVTAVKHEKEQHILKQEIPLMKSIREMDFRMADKTLQRQVWEKAVEESESKYQASLSCIVEMKESLRQSHTKLEDILQYIEHNAVDFELVENLAAIKQVFESLREMDRKYNEECEKMAAASELRYASQSALTELKCSHSKMVTQTHEAGEKHRLLLEDILTLLEGRELGDWRNDLDNLKERRLHLEKTRQSLESITEINRALGEIASLQETASGEQIRLSSQITSWTKDQEYREQEVGHLEIQVQLLQRIRSLEEKRADLEDGQPCPLCGATRHPYAEGNIPFTDDIELSLRQAKKELKEIADQLTRLRVQEAQTVKDLEQLHKSSEERHRILDNEKQKYSACLHTLTIVVTGQDDMDLIDHELSATSKQIHRCAQVIRGVEQKEVQAKAARLELDKLNYALAESERVWEKGRNDLKNAEQELERFQQNCASLGNGCVQASDMALSRVYKYGIEELSIAELSSTLDGLTRRRDVWQAKQATKEALQKNINIEEMELVKQQTLLGKLDEELQTQRLNLGHLINDLEGMERARRDIFGDKCPDAEEKRLAEAVEYAEKQLEQARNEVGKADLACKNLQDRVAALTAAIQGRTLDLTQAEQELHMRFIQAGFHDEAQYLGACLPEEERRRLSAKAESLLKEETEISTLIQDKTGTLRTEQAKMLTEQNSVQVEEDLARCGAKLNTLHQDIGAIKNRLAEDDQLRGIQGERIQIIEQQKKECTRWNLLHELIGSADGKKFRNFAQGLTLQMMIYFANQQLQKMTERYLLVCDERQLLELNVIDNYQAGQLRSTKNLSGGESFIVSLALALGLSHMASRNVRIDSFFLDEGFGTLDDDALDTALETLAGLQQDGKIIGLISHVAAIKERITTQIQVIPQTGGVSIITGPGCKNNTGSVLAK